MLHPEALFLREELGANVRKCPVSGSSPACLDFTKLHILTPSFHVER